MSRPGSYLLNSVTVVPGNLEAVYEAVAEHGSCTAADLRRTLDLRTNSTEQVDHVGEDLDFLVTVGLLTHVRPTYAALGGPLGTLAFRTTLLRGLREQGGKQADVMRIHELLIRQEVLATDAAQLMAFLNRHHFSTPGEAAVNDIKLGFWMRLLDYSGAIHQYENRKQIALTPNRHVLLALLKEFAGSAGEVSVPRFFGHVEEKYFAVRTEGRLLHPGVGAALLQLEYDGSVQLVDKSDAERVPLASNRYASHVSLKEDGAGDV